MADSTLEFDESGSSSSSQQRLDIVRVIAVLKRGIESRDANEIEDAVLSAFEIGLRPEFVPLFIRLLDLAGHHQHEDVVLALQELKDASAVNSLYNAAFVKHDYLAYDELFGLARKCTWALADIGTADALAKLRLMASSENRLIAVYAQKRIDNWDDEIVRKGSHKRSPPKK